MKIEKGSYQIHGITEHLIQSSVVAQTFRIRVLRPVSRIDESERFPVLYVTDGDHFFDALTNIALSLQNSGETPRFILVGIGYANARGIGLLRARDLYTHEFRMRLRPLLQHAVNAPLATEADDLETITETTDATEFLQFIRKELIPFIDIHYPSVPHDNNYFGYSAGAGFGLYTLFTKADTFKRYVLGSPTVSYGGYHLGIEMAQSFTRAGGAMDARVFLSIGELEEYDVWLQAFEFVTGYYSLAKYLRESPIPGLNLTTRLFPGETHATAWMLAFSHGTKAVFGPAGQVPYLPKFITNTELDEATQGKKR